MSLWKLELLYIFRSWRGWTLAALFLLASLLAIITGLLIDSNSDPLFTYDQVLDLYSTYTVVAWMLFIGLIVATLSIDSNKDLSTFLRLRFSVLRILFTKIVTWLLLSNGFSLLFFAITFIAANILFDSSDRISFRWMLWGLTFQLVGSLFYIALVMFTSAVFKGAVASVLLTLGVIIGVPVISAVLIGLEILMRGIEMTSGTNLEDISYIRKIILWWPAATSDAEAFLSITQSEIAADRISGGFGQSFDLDPWFRIKPLISSLVSAPVLALIAWRKFSRREI
jgi:hypothetical protein